MKNIFFFLGFSIILFQFNLNAQEETPQNLLETYDQIIDKANNWEDYKMVKKPQLNNFRNNLSKKLDELEKEVENHDNQLKKKERKIVDLHNQLETSQTNLEKITAQKNQILFFGSALSKSVYQATMWGIVGILVLILILLILKFKANSSATNEAKKQLDTVEKEFEDYKRKALEKQQKLGRELQDQKNLVNKLKANKQ